MKATRQLKLAEEMRKEAVRINGINFTGNAAQFGAKAVTAANQTWPVRAFRSVLQAMVPKELPKFDAQLTSKLTPSGIEQGRALTGRKEVYLQPKAVSENLFDRRGSVAHEGFHAANPVLGRSETLARFYGGWRSPRGAAPQLGRVGATNWERLRSGLSEVGTYYGRDIGAYSPTLKLLDEVKRRSRVADMQRWSSGWYPKYPTLAQVQQRAPGTFMPRSALPDNHQDLLALWKQNGNLPRLMGGPSPFGNRSLGVDGLSK